MPISVILPVWALLALLPPNQAAYYGRIMSGGEKPRLGWSGRLVRDIRDRLNAYCGHRVEHEFYNRTKSRRRKKIAFRIRMVPQDPPILLWVPPLMADRFRRCLLTRGSPAALDPVRWEQYEWKEGDDGR